MKKYLILCTMVSLGAFIGHRDQNLLDNKLTVVFTYCSPDKQDREGKKELQALIKAFDKFKESRHYRKIGLKWMKIDLAKDSEFKDTYLRETECSTPKIFFFERAHLLKDETLEVASPHDLTALLTKIFTSSKTQVGQIVDDLEEDYEEKQEALEEARAVNAYSLMYSSPWDWYHGYYSPYSGSYWHSGWGLGWGFRRHCH